MTQCDLVVMWYVQCGISEEKWKLLFLSSLFLPYSLGKEPGFGVAVMSVIFDFACK